jgi:hypothetical protein
LPPKSPVARFCSLLKPTRRSDELDPTGDRLLFGVSPHTLLRRWRRDTDDGGGGDLIAATAELSGIAEFGKTGKPNWS